MFSLEPWTGLPPVQLFSIPVLSWKLSQLSKLCNNGHFYKIIGKVVTHSPRVQINTAEPIFWLTSYDLRGGSWPVNLDWKRNVCLQQTIFFLNPYFFVSRCRTSLILQTMNHFRSKSLSTIVSVEVNISIYW